MGKVSNAPNFKIPSFVTSNLLSCPLLSAIVIIKGDCWAPLFNVITAWLNEPVEPIIWLLALTSPLDVTLPVILKLSATVICCSPSDWKALAIIIPEALMFPLAVIFLLRLLRKLLQMMI